MSPIALLSPVISPLHHLLVLISTALPVPAGGSLLIAVALVTLAVRAVLVPLSLHGFRTRQAGGHGFGSGLLQWPVLLALYGLVTVRQVGGASSALASAHLFTVPLQLPWVPALFATGFLSPMGALFVAILLGLCAVAYLAGRQTSRQVPEGPRVLRLLPFGTVVFALFSPIAVSVYLLSSTAWSVTERAMFTRLG